MTYHFNICTVSPDDKFIVHFVTGQLRPCYHHCDEMNYELVILTPGIVFRIRNSVAPDVAETNNIEFH